MNLFDRAKQIGLAHVRSWLPHGKMEGDEWVCLNPTRNDNKEGSFKVNLITGKWNDWADHQAGTDVVSLYAYLNRGRLEGLASGYKNFEGGVQAESAKEILVNYDASYFPSEKDVFEAPKGYWDGYRELGRGIENAPDPMETLLYNEKLFKSKYFKHWVFTDKKGLPLFLVARYYDGSGKKGDRPFCLWTNGTEYKWRAKNLESCLRPLYNLTEFTKELPVLMVEGQKNAHQAHEVLKADFICTTLYGKPEKVDLEPLRGRTVYYWFDPDEAGRKKLKAVEQALKDYHVIFKAVQSPARKEKGWDISDAIDEGWTRQQLIEHIEGQQEAVYLDDKKSFPFRIIGQNSEMFYFFPKSCCIVMKCKRTSVGKMILLNLMPREDWGAYFAQPEGGIAWDAASDYLITWGSKTRIFSNDLIRGAGAWLEGKKLILNTGSHLIIDGQQCDLYQEDTEYVYEKKAHVPYQTEDPIQDASPLLDLLAHLDFVDPGYKYLLAGWLMLAPFGGGLDWRPHVWLTGAKGAGKSYIMERIVYPMTGDYGVKALGSSTSAGLRQKLGNSSLPVMIDEAEGDTQKKRETLEDTLSMARQSCSGSENSADILHGTQDGGGTNWIVKSMFFFASIGPGLSHGADRSRVSLLKLKTPRSSDEKRRAENFKLLQKKEGLLTAMWVKSFHARTLKIFPELLKCCEIFREQVSSIMGNRRNGDQYGSLLAGSYMLEHDEAPPASIAKEYLSQFKFLTEEDPSGKDDEELCLDEIMSYKVQIGETKYSIGVWLSVWFSRHDGSFDRLDYSDLEGVEVKRIKRELEDHGVKPMSGGTVQVALGHPALQRILSKTAWADTYGDIIERVDFCEGRGKGTAVFGSIKKRYVILKAIELLGDGVPF